jgi:hypothetical protein
MKFQILATALPLVDIVSAMDAAGITGIRGFNSGAFKKDYSAKTQTDFEAEMRAAQKLHVSPDRSIAYACIPISSQGPSPTRSARSTPP